MKGYWLIVMFVLLSLAVSSTELRLPSGDTISLTIITAVVGNGTGWNQTGARLFPADAAASVGSNVLSCTQALETNAAGDIVCGTDATGSDPSAWNGLNLSRWFGFNGERDANSSVLTKNNESFIQEQKVKNATWSDNSSGVDWNQISKIPSGFADGIDDTGAAGSGINNGSSGNLTNLNVLTINNTLLSLFNKSVMLTNYNFSIDLSGYAITSLLGAIFSNFQILNWTTLYDNQASTRFSISNGTSLPFSNFQIANISSGAFSNMQMSNVTGAISNTSYSLRNNTDTQFANLTANNLNVSSVNNTIGKIEFIQFNSSCSGFRMNSSAPPILSCG